MARVLQNGNANGKARENGWKEVTGRAESKGHNSRVLSVKGIIKQQIELTPTKL
jgi:hypothetical protein